MFPTPHCACTALALQQRLGGIENASPYSVLINSYQLYVAMKNSSETAPDLHFDIADSHVLNTPTKETMIEEQAVNFN